MNADWNAGILSHIKHQSQREKILAMNVITIVVIVYGLLMKLFFSNALCTTLSTQFELHWMPFTQREIPTKLNKSRKPCHCTVNYIWRSCWHYGCTLWLHLIFPKIFARKCEFIFHVLIFNTFIQFYGLHLERIVEEKIIAFCSLLVSVFFCFISLCTLPPAFVPRCFDALTYILPDDLLRFDRRHPLFCVVNLLTT